jgi:hypothetical protein
MEQSLQKTKIDFKDGFDQFCKIPSVIKELSFDHRFAVIQQTYRCDLPDIYFDHLLWEIILEFALQFGQTVDVRIVAHEGVPEVKSEEFVASFDKLGGMDREPPEFIIVREKGEIVLCIATEYWAHIGGPSPYHDSYTYSFYSSTDISKRIIAFLVASERLGKWQLNKPD